MTFREDDLTRSETTCLMNCFSKHYRYLAYANSLYSYLIAGDSSKMDDHIKDNYEGVMGIGEEEE